MGGMNTLNLSIPNLKQFASVSVFRSGWFGGRLKASEKKFAAALCDANAKKHLKLEWFSTGSQDFLLGATKDTIVLLEGHGCKVEYHESGAGHTWEN